MRVVRRYSKTSKVVDVKKATCGSENNHTEVISV